MNLNPHHQSLLSRSAYLSLKAQFFCPFRLSVHHTSSVTLTSCSSNRRARGPLGFLSLTMAPGRSINIFLSSSRSFQSPSILTPPSLSPLRHSLLPPSSRRSISGFSLSAAQSSVLRRAFQRSKNIPPALRRPQSTGEQDEIPYAGRRQLTIA